MFQDHISSLEAYRAAREHVAFADRSTRGRLLLSGPDRASLLQGLLTNDMLHLAPSHGCYAAFLSPQGRMIADLYVYELGDAILLAMEPGLKQTVFNKLEQSIFTEEVELQDLDASLTEIAVVGPQAVPCLVSCLPDVEPDALGALAEHDSLHVDPGTRFPIIIRNADLGVPGFELYLERARGADVATCLATCGGLALPADVAEVLRVEAGLPRFHRDMDEETIPLEAGIEGRAISMTKGCYVGQEVIVRILHRGHGRIAKKLMGLTFEGARVPPAGAIVTADGREVGRLTSPVYSPARGCAVALAYVHRDFWQPGVTLDVGGGPAVVTELPFVGTQP